LSEVREFARERPGIFLALALGAGVVTARLGRGIAGAQSDDSDALTSTHRVTPAQASEPTVMQDPDVAPLETPVYDQTTETSDMRGLPGPLEYPEGGARV
jgi:hypothetical protein